MTLLAQPKAKEKRTPYKYSVINPSIFKSGLMRRTRPDPLEEKEKKKPEKARKAPLISTPHTRGMTMIRQTKIHVPIYLARM